MIRDDKELDVAPASQPPLSHPSGAEPASAVSGKAGIANAATFTPGPWRWVAEDCSMCSLERDVGMADEPEHVLTVTICRNCQGRADDRGRWEWDRCYTANEANARLIAAAPELHKWLTLALGIIDASGVVWMGADSARAALAKAQAA